VSRKEKKEIAQKVLSELVAEYDFKKTVTAPKEDLLGIEQQMPTKRGITGMLESKWWTGYDQASMRKMSLWIYFMQSQIAKAG
jgi:hypothetical protein